MVAISYGIVADDIEMPRGSKLPLWMIGMTY